MKKNQPQTEICRRIAQIRMEMDGPRGKAAFCKKLALPPSTYEYYESSRVPPADILVRVADLAQVDLHWLLTGVAAGGPSVPASHPVLRAAGRLLAGHESAAGPLAAFVEILSATLKFPAKGEAADAGAAVASGEPASPAPDAAEVRRSWIPVLGRSAAGIAQFWASDQEARGVTTIDDLLARRAAGQASEVLAAVAIEDDKAGATAVQIITLTAPGENDVGEYVQAPSVKRRHGDSFAVRIDGQSMAPEICNGDLVVLSPSVPAVQGRAAVVQLRRQIGLTCKLYRTQGPKVHLVPLNEQFAPQTFDAAEVVWALRVLAKVRPGARQP